MATTAGTFEHTRSGAHVGQYKPTAGMRFFVPVGRLLFGLIFLMSSFSHFSASTIEYARSAGVPMPGILVPASGVLAFLGAASIVLGLRARVGAVMLLIFLIPVTFMMHDFWNISDPGMRAMQMSHFMKNLALIGTCCLFYYFGSGPVSLDRKGKYHPSKW